MAFNYSKLLGRIVEKYGTQSSFAKALSISEHSLSLKLNNKRDFKQREIIAACQLLEIATDEIDAYFFTA